MPVVVLVYLETAIRRTGLRAIAAVGLGAMVTIAALSAGAPASTTASPPTVRVPLTTAAFRPVSVGLELDTAMTIEFSGPMDARSVEASILVDPPTRVELSWDDTGRVLTVVPSGRWAPGVFQTIEVAPGALAANGRPLTKAARVTFMTRAATSGRIVPTAPAGGRVGLASGFDVLFGDVVDHASVVAGIRLEPPVAGAVRFQGSHDGLTRYSFQPDRPLRPDSRYRVIVSGVRDVDGVALETMSLSIRTATRPSIVRVRPRDGLAGVDRGAAISVRFSEPVEPESVRRAFTVTADGTRVDGVIRFAEGGLVAVFDPSAALPYDAAVVVRVGIEATSRLGSAIGRVLTTTFTTERRPVAKPTPTRVAIPTSSGGSVGGGTWKAVEWYYLRLMNCTRTGGWVTSSGSCSSPGGRAVAPLKLDAGISSKVSRPYAKLLATRGLCTHFIGGSPGDRLRRAGYRSYRWAENLGCRSGNPTAAVLGTHLFFQSEKSYLGGHYVNLMNAAYDRAGIGVWVSSGRVRLVVDFYHP
ncbi:MAG: Ig-like domain-containing protein [Chloroflexi bacterium]|nr:Ig-like domain-containing protein [Chloroflexota bacterium]